MEAFREASSNERLMHLLEGPLSAIVIDSSISEWMTEICNKAESTTDMNTKLALLRFTLASIVPCLSRQRNWTQSDEWQRLSLTCLDVYKQLEERVGAPSGDAVEDVRHVIGMQLECLDLLTSLFQASQAEDRETRLNSRHGSVISHCLYTVTRMFQHCQSSETFYAQKFSQMAETLASAFRKSFSLFKCCILFLDGVEPSMQDSHVTLSVAKQLTEISETSCSFDAVCLQTCWKTFVRFVIKHRNCLDRDACLRSLSSAVMTWFTKCLSVAPVEKQSLGHCQPEETKQFVKGVKALRFMFVLVLKLCQECEDALHSNIRSLFDLALMVESCSLPSVCPPTLAVSAKEELETNILPVIEPLTALLMSHMGLVGVLRKQVDINNRQHSAYVCFLLRVIDSFDTLSPAMKDALMDRTSSVKEDSNSCVLLDALFSAVTECYVELSLPIHIKASLVKTKPLQDISLYDRVCSRVCSFIAQLPAKYFPSLEQCLLRQVLSDYPHCATLATDVWCFIARWGSAQLCCDLVISLGLLLVALPVTPHLPSYQHICLLVRRLFPLLAVQHQVVVLEQFDPSVDISTLRLWKEIPFQRLSKQTLDKMLHHLPLICSQGFSQENPSLAYCSLRFLSQAANLGSEQSAVYQKHLLSVIDPLVSLLQTAIATQQTTYISSVLDFLSAILSSIQPTLCYKVLQMCQQLAAFPSPPLDCLISLTQFLTSLGRIRFPSAHTQVCLCAISSLFQKLLSSTDWLIHHHSLLAFQSFAEYTPHSDVIQDCVPEQMKGCVADFMHGVAFGGRSDENVEPTVMRLRQGLEEFRSYNADNLENGSAGMDIEQSLELDINDLSTSQEVVVIDSDEPMEKKRKVNRLSDVGLYRQVVDTIVVGIGKLQGLLDKDNECERVPPAWLTSELATAREELRKLVKRADSYV